MIDSFKYILSILCWMLCMPTFAQQATMHKGLWHKAIPDSSYIRSYYNYWCVTAHHTFNYLSMDLSAINENASLTYETDMPFSTGLMVDYKWFTLGFSRNTGQIRSYDQPGRNLDSRHYSLQAGITGRKFWLHSILQRYQGLYLSEVKLPSPVFSLPPDAVLPREDVYVQAWFTTAQYAFKANRYSHMATLWQLEQQLKSAGTAFVGIMSSLYELRADSSLVPLAARVYFPNEGERTRREYLNLMATGGYTHTFVWKKMFCNLSGSLGMGIQTNRPENKIANMAINTDIQGVLAYNGPVFFGGSQLQARTFVDNVFDESSYVQTFLIWRFFAGMRFRGH